MSQSNLLASLSFWLALSGMTLGDHDAGASDYVHYSTLHACVPYAPGSTVLSSSANATVEYAVSLLKQATPTVQSLQINVFIPRNSRRTGEASLVDHRALPERVTTALSRAQSLQSRFTGEFTEIKPESFGIRVLPPRSPEDDCEAVIEAVFSRPDNVCKAGQRFCYIRCDESGCR